MITYLESLSMGAYLIGLVRLGVAPGWSQLLVLRKMENSVREYTRVF
jgi:hypothetical protein